MCISVGVVTLLSGPVLIQLAHSLALDDASNVRERSLDIGRHRRLDVDDDEGGSAYPADPLISKPYDKAPSSEKCAIIIHIILIGYMLLGLNTVCDVYFCGALDMLVDRWNVKPDVAGATFMAAGGSAPELCTSLIGACITANDVGFGTIVGSAVFNVLAVIGACGISARSPIKLTWWPLFRDCTFYVLSLGLLAALASGPTKTNADGEKEGGGSIGLWEAFLLFFAYTLYCAIMYFNELIETTVTELAALFGKRIAEPTRVVPAPAPVIVAPASVLNVAERSNAWGDVVPSIDGTGSTSQAQDRVDTRHVHHIETHIREVCHRVHKSPRVRRSQSLHAKKSLLACNECAEPVRRSQTLHAKKSHGAVNGQSLPVEPTEPAPMMPDLRKDDQIKENDDEDSISGSTDISDEIEALMLRPDGTRDQIMWYLSLPVNASLYYGIPKPTDKYYLISFAVSLIWIAGFSFILVYCVEIFGTVVFGGGNEVTVVMSMTLLASGTSIPDLVSSMAVARAGQGDMAVSSSIGSNIFDILVGLPIPWILKIGLIEQGINGNSGFEVAIKSPYIVLYVLLLLFMICCIIVAIHCLGWVLNRTLGFCMALLYLLFLAIVLPIELLNKGPYL